MPKQHNEQPQPVTILRFRDLQARGVVSNWSTLQSWIRDEGFPPGVMLGANSRGWFESDVVAWLKSRPAAGETKQRQREHAT